MGLAASFRFASPFSFAVLAVAAGTPLFQGACSSSTNAGPSPSATFDSGPDKAEAGVPEAGEADTGNNFGEPPEAGGDAACAASSAQAQKSSVDIIFVIDDSGSMTEEMAQVKTNVNSFAEKIGNSGLDYRVIVMTQKGTTGNAICVPPPLGGPSCADNPPKFFHIDRDVESNDALSLILETYDSNDPNLAWNKHLRQDSYKVFVVVTDDNAYGVTSEDFDPKLLAKMPLGMFGDARNRKYIMDSIVGWQEGTLYVTGPTCSTAVNNGSEYQKLSKLTDGIIASVCNTDYSPVLDNLANGINKRLACEIKIPSPDGGAIDPTKVAVQFTPSGGTAKTLTQVTDPSKCGAIPDGWYYDDKMSPTKILLCPSTCTTVSGDTSARLDVLLGCKTPIPK